MYESIPTVIIPPIKKFLVWRMGNWTPNRGAGGGGGGMIAVGIDSYIRADNSTGCLCYPILNS